MLKEIKLSDLSDIERSTLIDEVDRDNAGCGILHTGKYYIVAHRPLKNPVNYKCIGVEIFIHVIEKSNKQPVYFSNCKVLFKEGFFTLEKRPFKDRLDKAIKEQIGAVIKSEKEFDDNIARIAKEERDREQAIKDHTESIRACQLKINTTIKTLVPNSKSLIEYKNEQLLAAKSDVESEPVAETMAKLPKEDSAPGLYPRGSNHDICYEDNFSKKEYTSEKEKQMHVNDTILKTEPFVKRNRSQVNAFMKTRASQTPPNQPRDFIDDMRFDEPIPMCEMESTFHVDKDNVITAELFMPEDPKYKTDLEKQNAIQNYKIDQKARKITG